MALYKYVTKTRFDVLENGYIRFTQPAAFNDPFELFPYFESISPEKNIEQYIRKYEWDEAGIDQMMEESWQKELKKYPGVNIPFPLIKSLMKNYFDQRKPLIMEMFQNFMTMKSPEFRELAINTIMKSINDTIGILCLSETPDNILMWSHYSANHTGFVIEFDENHSFFDQRKKENEISGHIKKVRYSRMRPQIILFDPNLSNEENVEKWIKDFFWVKSSDWTYEQEWRITQTFRDWKGIIKETIPPTYLFPMPTDCIKAIIVGCRVKMSDLELLKILLKSDSKFSHIIMKKASIDEKQYQINIKEINI